MLVFTPDAFAGLLASAVYPNPKQATNAHATYRFAVLIFAISWTILQASSIAACTIIAIEGKVVSSFGKNHKSSFPGDAWRRVVIQDTKAIKSNTLTITYAVLLKG
ncbi:MAG: hypothetical protein JRJ24_06185 [Deltaproteobacteria bacterium]|nr:hypothetical protein [Deltaproteobacteria bacterium]